MRLLNIFKHHESFYLRFHGRQTWGNELMVCWSDGNDSNSCSEEGAGQRTGSARRDAVGSPCIIFWLSSLFTG